MVQAAIFAGLGRMPRGEDRLDRATELLLRRLRERLAGTCRVNLEKTPGEEAHFGKIEIVLVTRTKAVVAALKRLADKPATTSPWVATSRR